MLKATLWKFGYDPEITQGEGHQHYGEPLKVFEAVNREHLTFLVTEFLATYVPDKITFDKKSNVFYPRYELKPIPGYADAWKDLALHLKQREK